MQTPMERPPLGTQSASKISRTSTNRASSVDERDAINRGSVDTSRTPKGKKKPQRAGSTHTQHTLATPRLGGGDDLDVERGQPGSYFEDSAPSQSQFLAARGRPMSFYDMKEQAKQAKQAKQNNSTRQSWRSGDMPYSYADIIGDNRFNYEPPSMGRKQEVSKSKEPEISPMRLPWMMWIHSDAKNHFVAALGEWVGTTMFLFFAFAGTQVANAKSKAPGDTTTTNATAGFSPIVMLYISVSFGFSLMVNVWVFFRISGGLFNPAVTLALWACGAVDAMRAVVLFMSQIVGSITASALVLAMFPTPFNLRTTLSDGTSIPQGLFIEAFMTAELVFTILMLAKEKHRSTFIAPVGIGLALFIAELVGVYYTGGSLNPARSFGPCVITGTFDREHWIYWAGPALGCVFAIAFYKFIKMLEYEMANPGQDGDEANDPTKNPHHELREKQREVTGKILASLGIDHATAAVVAAPPNHNSDALRSAEEGTYFTNSTSSTMDENEHDRRFHPGANNAALALSTVASMSDHDHINSPHSPRGSSRLASPGLPRTSDSIQR